MDTVDTFVRSRARQSATASSPASLPLTLADLERFVSSAKAGDRIVYHRGFLAMDRGVGSRLGEEAGDELDRMASTVVAMAEVGQLHLVQRRHGPRDYEYIAVVARSRGQGGSGRSAWEIAS